MRRKTGFFSLFFLSFLTATISAGLADEKRVALVIGNSAYKHAGELPNPVNDAAAIAKMLKTAGFNVVESRRDLGINEMRRAIRDFTDNAKDADIAVVFYAGHGIEVDGANYLIPVDAALDRDIDVEDEAVSLDRIVRVLDPVKRLRLIILDACRVNPFAKTMKRTIGSRAIGRGLAKIEPASSDTLIAFAAKAGSTAADGDGAKNSPFTTALVKNLAIPGLDLRIAFGRVRDDVLKATGSKQEPFVYGSLGGTTVALVPPPESKPAVVVAPAPAPVAANSNTEMRRDYELASQVGTKEAWDYFLVRHTAGFYADLARAARGKIVAEETRIVAAAKAAAEAKSADEAKAAAAAKAAKTMVIAAVPPTAPVETPKASAAGPNIAEIAKQMQGELRRLGCYPGALNGEWNSESRRALERFNTHAGIRLDVKLVSLDSLDVVRGKTTRICPLQCEKGYKADGETCIKMTCPAGQVIGDEGTCENKEKPRTASRPEPRRPAPEESKPAAAKPSGQIVCGRHGCQEVKANCRTVPTVSGSAHGGGPNVVCN